jgi:hypothetical protein
MRDGRVKRVAVMIQENHITDNYFGPWPRWTQQVVPSILPRTGGKLLTACAPACCSSELLPAPRAPTPKEKKK